MEALLPILLFVCLFVVMLTGFPVAFVLGGVSVIFGMLFFEDNEFFYLLPMRIFGIMNNYVLLAVPLFVFMGLMLEKSGIAERLLDTMGLLMGKISGGLAISVLIVGTLLAASTGVVGATVVTMGLLSLPAMLKRGYNVAFATGTIAASGTLGQMIPPSVVLVLLGSVMSVSVGELFKAALVPSMLLVGFYMLYIFLYALFFPKKAPALSFQEIAQFRKKDFYAKVFRAFVLPMLLILAVLGAIFFGIASPTEAAGVGAAVATLLTFTEKKLSWEVLRAVMRETLLLTSMVFMILVGASAFGLIFRELEGDLLLIEWIKSQDLSAYGFLAIMMLGIFVAGFFIDFIEIIFIFIPVLLPVLHAFQMDLLWVGILVALNLQSSFLTPPFGFSLFYLKGVAPPSVRSKDLYIGVIPFVLIQLFLLALLILFPDLVTWLPKYLA